MAASRKKNRELTGRHVLIILLAFFGVIFAVNGSFLFAAVSSFSGEDVKGSYRQGLEYNQTLDARQTQNTLGWGVAANYVVTQAGEGRVIVRFRNAAEAPLNGLDIAGNLRHPTDLAKDRSLAFKPEGNGIYAARTEPLTGKWELHAAARQGDEVFRFQYKLQP